MKSRSVLYIVLSLWLIVSYNSQFASISVPLIGFGINVILAAIIMLLSIPSALNKRFNVYQKWALLLLVFWAASTRWSANPESFQSLFAFSIPYLVCFLLSANILTTKNVETVLRLELVAVFLCAIYVMFFVNTGNLADERLGGNEEGRVWNANDIGMKMTIGYAICVYLLLKSRTNKVIIYGMMAIILVVALMSGSRKVIIFLVMFTALLMIMRAKGGKRVLYIAYAGLFVVFAYVAVMNIPILYGILGNRIDLMLDGLRGDGGGYSIYERTRMIGYGLEFISGHLWFGNGYNAFSVLFGDITGWYTYSHNNFIELLVNTGVIGLLLYYYLSLYIIKGLWKPALKGRDTLSQVLLLYTVISFFLDYAMVSYVNLPTVFRLMYTAQYCQIVNSANALRVRE